MPLSPLPRRSRVCVRDFIVVSCAHASISLAQFWSFFYALLPFGPCCGMFGGLLLGYVGYDLTHYYLHHGTSTWALPRQLKVTRTPRAAQSPARIARVRPVGASELLPAEVAPYGLSM